MTRASLLRVEQPSLPVVPTAASAIIWSKDAFLLALKFSFGCRDMVILTALWIDPVLRVAVPLLWHSASYNDFQLALQQACLFIICCHAWFF